MNGDKKTVITMRSGTNATHAARVLAANKINVRVIGLPSEYSKNGCSWGIELDGTRLSETLHILKVSDINYGRVIK